MTSYLAYATEFPTTSTHSKIFLYDIIDLIVILSQSRWHGRNFNGIFFDLD